MDKVSRNKITRFYFPADLQSGELILNKDGMKEYESDFTPSFKHYDVHCTWDKEDGSNKDTDGISTLGYSRLLYARFRDCGHGGAEHLGIEPPPIPNWSTSVPQVGVSPQAPDPESRRQWAIFKPEKVEMADINRLAKWVATLRPRSANDLKPMCILQQKLLEDIVQDKVVFFSTELIASRMKFDERMQEAEKTIQRLKDEIVAINQDALSEVIEDFEEPPPSEGGPSKRSSLVGTISLDPGFLNSISEQQAQATNSEKDDDSNHNMQQLIADMEAMSAARLQDAEMEIRNLQQQQKKLISEGESKDEMISKHKASMEQKEKQIFQLKADLASKESQIRKLKMTRNPEKSDSDQKDNVKLGGALSSMIVSNEVVVTESLRILQWEEKSKDQMAIDLATMSPGEAAYILAGLGFTEALALISHMQPNQAAQILNHCVPDLATKFLHELEASFGTAVIVTMDYTAVAMCGDLSELIHKLNSVTGSQLLVEQRKFRDWVKAANQLDESDCEKFASSISELPAKMVLSLLSQVPLKLVPIFFSSLFKGPALSSAQILKGLAREVSLIAENTLSMSPNEAFDAALSHHETVLKQSKSRMDFTINLKRLLIEMRDTYSLECQFCKPLISNILTGKRDMKAPRMSNKIKTKSMSRSERKFDEKAIKSIERLGLESEGQEEADNERMSVIATSMLAISESLHKEIDLEGYAALSNEQPHRRLGYMFLPVIIRNDDNEVIRESCGVLAAEEHNSFIKLFRLAQVIARTVTEVDKNEVEVMKLVAPAIESRTLPSALDEDSALFFSRALGVARRQYLDKLYTHMQEFVELKSYAQPTQTTIRLLAALLVVLYGIQIFKDIPGVKDGNSQHDLKEIWQVVRSILVLEKRHSSNILTAMRAYTETVNQLQTQAAEIEAKWRVAEAFLHTLSEGEIERCSNCCYSIFRWVVCGKLQHQVASFQMAVFGYTVDVKEF